MRIQISFASVARPLVWTVVLAAGSGFALYGSGTANAAASSAPAVAIEDELEKAMDTIDQGVESLQGAIEKKDAAGALEHVSRVQSAILEAKLLQPPKTKTVEEKARPAFLNGFRKSLSDLLKHFCDVEMAVCEGDFAKAGSALGEVQRLKKAGHDEYKKMKK
jgi:soluble cytochrome b562